MSEKEVNPAAILRGIDDDRLRAQAAFAPNMILLYATWGIAWIVGFSAVYLAIVPAERPLIPFSVGAVIAAVMLVAAIVLSATHSVRRVSGSRGPSMVQGAIYGNSFSLAFILMGLLGWRLTSAGISLTVMLSYWVASISLVVGILTAVGAAMWNEKSQLVFGAWIVVVGLISIALPPPHTLLAGIVGGIGFLGFAVIQLVRPSLISGPITRGADG